jgi:peptidoglycan-N-acetylglucosamine deacetylase
MAWNATPRLYRLEAPTAAAIPSTRSTMSAHDDRITAGAITGAVAVSAAVAYALPALCAPWPALRAPLGVGDRTKSGRGYALTFDDGPHAQGTPAVLEILAAAGVPATFFLVGEQVQGHRPLVAEILARGHTIGLHCHRHRNLLRLTPRQVHDDLARAHELIAEAAGLEPELYRPPYGVLNAAALREARRRGWRTLLWSHWGRDWEAKATPASIAARLTSDLRDGAVLLLHDADRYSAAGSWRRTAAALPRVIELLEARGLKPAAA